MRISMEEEQKRLLPTQIGVIRIDHPVAYQTINFNDDYVYRTAVMPGNWFVAVTDFNSGAVNLLVSNHGDPIECLKCPQERQPSTITAGTLLFKDLKDPFEIRVRARPADPEVKISLVPWRALPEVYLAADSAAGQPAITEVSG